MAKTQIDFSGIKGLAPRFYGDKSLTASQPHLRYLGVDGQMAEGIFNPISTLGYMSPANNTTKACTGTTSYLLSTAIVVPQRIAGASTDAIFFGDEAVTGADGQIVNLDTAIDTSLDATDTLDNILNPSPTFKTNFSSEIDSFLGVATIRPVSTTKPSIQAMTRKTTGSGTTSTNTVAVPASLSDSVAYVFVVKHTNNNYDLPTATFDGNAMTLYTAGSLGGGASALQNCYYFLFYYRNPTSGNKTATVTFPSSENYLVQYSFVADNVHATGAGIYSLTTGNANNLSTIEITRTNIYDNVISLGFTFSETTTHSFPLAYNQLLTYNGSTFNGTNGFGRDSLSYFDTPRQYYKCDDLIEYQVNGVPKIFIAKRGTTATSILDDIVIADLDFSNPDLDWLTTTPAGYGSDILTPHGKIIFLLSDNSFLYVLNGNKVHKIDGGLTGGTGGTLTDSVLQFLGTEENAITYIQDGIDLRGKMWIGIHVNSYFDTRVTDISTKSIPMFVGVYVWNRSSVVASMQDFIPIVGVKELKSMHTFQGQASCFTMSVDGYTQFRVWNGTEFKVVQTLGTNAYPVYRKHSVYEEGDRIWWFGNDGKIYCYGRIEPGFDNALYIMGDMSDKVTAEATFSGAGVMVAANATETVTSGNQTQPLAFYLSYKDTAGNHLRKWYPYSTETVATVAQTGHQGNVYTLVKYLPDMSTVKYVDIRCAPTGTGTTTIATIKYYFNGSSTSSFSKTITKDQASRGYIRHEINKPYVNAIQMEIEYSTANTLGAGNDFRPSMALIEYTETTTKG